MDRLSYFLNLLEKAPNNPMVHYSLAQEYYKAGNVEEAIKHLEKYLSLQEDEGAAYRLLAKCYEELGEYQKAIEALKKGITQASKYNHPSMVEEFSKWIQDLEALA